MIHLLSVLYIFSSMEAYLAWLGRRIAGWDSTLEMDAVKKGYNKDKTLGVKGFSFY